MNRQRTSFIILVLACFLWVISGNELAAYPDIVYLHMGDPSGEPIRAFINDRISIDVYCLMSSQSVDVSNLHVPVGVMDIYIDSMFSESEGQVYGQLLNWDMYYFNTPEHGGPNPPGWTNQSFVGFADLGGGLNPWLRCYAWTKVITFVGKTKNDSNLAGQTISCFGPGLSNTLGGPSAGDTVGSVGFPVVMEYSSVSFFSPSDSAVIKGRIVNYSSGVAIPQSGAQVAIFNPDRSCSTDFNGQYFFTKALPGSTRFMFSVSGYDDSSIILNIAPAETTTLDFSIYSGAVQGTVYDNSVVPPIPINGVVVAISNSRKSDTTDESGYYRIDNLFAGFRTLKYSHSQYLPDSTEDVNVQNGILTTANKNLTRKHSADVGVYYIENLPDTFQVGHNYSIYRCDVANYGLDSQSFNVVYSVRPVSSDTFTFIDTESVTVGPLQTHWVNYDGSFTPSERGYEFKVYTVLFGDANNHNDTLTKTVFDLLPLSYVGGVENNRCDAAIIANNTAFGISGNYFKIIEISDPDNQVEVFRRQLPGYAYDIKMKGNVVYLCEFNYGLHTFRVANPPNPIDMGYSLPQTGVYDISIQGNYAFLACRDIGLIVASLADSLHPVECARLQLPPNNETVAIKISGDYAYLAITEWKLAVIYIANPLSPVLVDLVAFPLDYLEDIDIYGDYLFIETSMGFIEIVDISNPASPQLINIIDYNCCYSSGIGIANNHLFINVSHGVYIYDITDALNPTYKGHLLARGVSGKILSNDNNIYLLGSGIKVFRWRDPVSAIPCVFTRGDVNGDAFCNSNDVTYGVRFFKGTGNSPADSCWNNIDSLWIYSGGDINGNCEFRGSDISYLVAYFKGFQPSLKYCPWTPPQGR